MSWCVYILKCSDGSYYTGHTDDIDQRLKKHNAGRGAVHTASRYPVSLVYQESATSKKAAIKREIQIKKWSNAKKTALIQKDMIKLKTLSRCQSLHGKNGQI